MTAHGADRPILRTAIIGAGLMGRWHAHAVARAAHLVVAIVDPLARAAERLAARHRSARAFATLDEVPFAVDVVHVCTPIGSHHDLITRALARGCHVIAEKPLAQTAAETRELYAVAAARQRLLVPVHQFLYQRGVLEAARLLPSIGPLLHFEATACTAGAAGRTAAEHDRVALEILPHPLSLITRLVSREPEKAGWRVRRVQAGELRLDGVLNATTISVLVSTGGRPPTNTVRLIGANGTVHVDLFHGFATQLGGGTTRGAKIAGPFLAAASVVRAAASNLARRAITGEPAYPGLNALVRHVYDVAANGGAAPIAPEETVAVATAMDAIASEVGAATGRPLLDSLPLGATEGS